MFWTCSGYVVDLHILQLQWLRTLWSISQERDLSQIWNLHKHSKDINFHYRANSVKINDQIWYKPYIWFNLFIVLIRVKQVFSKILNNFTSVSTTIPKFRENWWSNSKKKPGQREQLIDPISQNQSSFPRESNLISLIDF